MAKLYNSPLTQDFDEHFAALPNIIDEFNTFPVVNQQHYDLRAFHATDVTVPNLMSDFDYWNASHFDGSTVQSLTLPRSVVGRSVASRTMTEVDTFTGGYLDTHTLTDIELATVQSGNEGWPTVAMDPDVTFGPDSSLRYANTIRISLTGGVTKTVTSTFRDNILTDMNIPGGTYLIDLALPGFPAQAAGTHLDLTNSFIDFTSDSGYAAGQTDSIPFSSSLHSLTAGGDTYFQINRNSLVNVNLSNITGIRFRLKSVGNMTFVAQAMRVYKTGTGGMSYQRIMVDTKRDTFRMAVPQTGSTSGETAAGMTNYYFNNVRPKNAVQVIKFNTGHLDATNQAQLQLIFRHDTTTSNDIFAFLGMTSAGVQLLISQKTNGTGIGTGSYTTLYTTTPATVLTNNTDYYLIATLQDNKMRITVNKAVGPYVGPNIIDSGQQTVTLISRGLIGFKISQWNYNFSIDWIRNSHAEFGRLEIVNATSPTPVVGASLWTYNSPPIDLTEQNFIPSGDAIITDDPNFGDPAPSLHFTRDGSSFYGGMQTTNFLFVGDLKHAYISGQIFPTDADKPHRIVLLDKYDSVSFIQYLTNLKINQWNEFVISLSTNIEPQAYRLIIQQVGATAGEFWLQDFKLNHDTFAWQASANGGTNWLNFYHNVNADYKGVNFKQSYGQLLKVRAIALTDNARIEGYRIKPIYGYPGRT